LFQYPICSVNDYFEGSRIWLDIGVLEQKDDSPTQSAAGRKISPFGGLLSRSKSRVCLACDPVLKIKYCTINAG